VTPTQTVTPTPTLTPTQTITPTPTLTPTNTPTPSFVFDSDAMAYFGRVTDAGGTLSNTEKTAVNQLVLDMKDDGIWNSIKAIYPFVGASAAACAQNLKSSGFTGTFTSGWIFAGTGVKGNGSSTGFRFGFNNNNFDDYNSQHIMKYTVQGVDGDSWDTGNISVSSTLNSRMNTVGTDTAYQLASTTLFSNTSSASGFYLISRNSTTLDFYNNSTKVVARANSIMANTNNLDFVMGNQFNDLRPGNGSDSEFRLYSIGAKLSDTEASNFYTAVQSFQTTLSRQV
jgi:hypothetical protein